MLGFAAPHSVYEPVEDNQGRFVVEPLARGFGYTLGNSLRRVLLSSLEGAAVSAIKITGVEHEFSTVPHVKEDVTDIILNLKKVVFVLHGEDDEHEVELVKDGPGSVTAGDIKLPATVEVVDPSVHIAALEDGGRLEMRLTVSSGHGYASAEDNKRSETIVGLIPVDSIFSPVTRVAYSVEPARVGQRTDFDRLTLEVETNGAIKPEEAVSQAAAMLQKELAIFHTDMVEPEDMDEPGSEEVFGTSGGDTPEPLPAGVGDTPIEELELGIRSYNCLKRANIATVGDLVANSEQDLMCIPNLGRKTVEEVRERLEKINLKLKGE